MNFSEALKETVSKVDGAVAAMIIASDGISVEEYVSEKLIDLAGLGAEASAMIRDIGMAEQSVAQQAKIPEILELIGTDFAPVAQEGH